MKIALVSTPANLEIAQRVIEGSCHGSTITHYFKRGGVCHKSESQAVFTPNVRLSRWAMIKDIRAERFAQVHVVEFPHGRTNVLPFYALVAILSKAPGKFVIGADGRKTPITAQGLAKLIMSYSGMFLLYIALVPLLLANFALLIAGSVVVDAMLLMKPIARNAASDKAGETASK